MWVPPLFPLPALNAANFHPEGKARGQQRRVHVVDPLSTAFCRRDGLWLFGPRVTCSAKHCWLIPPSAVSVRDRGLPPASTPRARVPTLEPVGQAGWRLPSPWPSYREGGRESIWKGLSGPGPHGPSCSLPGVSLWEALGGSEVPLPSCPPVLGTTQPAGSLHMRSTCYAWPCCQR